MTFNELQQEVYRRLNKATASPDTATATRIKSFLNGRMRELLGKPGLSKLRDVILPFTAVADQAHYGLGPGIVDVYRIVDQTNRIVLEERTPAWYRQVDPTPTTGTSWTWINYGIQPVFLQPVAATTSIVAVSTAAGDTQTIRMEFLATTRPAFRVAASQTMNGVTPVTVQGSLTTPIQITQLRLSSVAIGIVQVYEDSATTGTQIAIIETGQTSSRDFRFALWPTPSTAQEYLIECAYALTDMVNDTDVPPFPEDYHDILADGACVDECLKMDDARAASYASLWESRVKDIYFRLHGRIVHGGDVDRVFGAPRSRLGPYFPAGS